MSLALRRVLFCPKSRSRSDYTRWTHNLGQEFKADDGLSASHRAKAPKPKFFRSRDDGPRIRAEGEAVEPRLPKKKVAMIISFCGSAYRGMQYQHPSVGVKTVEGTLFDAFTRVGAISKDNSDALIKNNWSRAARTDSGVHAAGNVVSFKMVKFLPKKEDMLARIKEELPPDIRVWDFVYAGKSFAARRMCDSRRYLYFFPSYLLIPPKPGSGYTRAMERHTGEVSDKAVDPFWRDIDLENGDPRDELARKRAWRVTPDHLTRLRAITPQFEGRHNYWNFTMSATPDDASNIRIMNEIKVMDPQVHGDTEWIPVLFHGQSFMRHQRRMMFTLLMCARCEVPPTLIPQLLSPDLHVRINMVPALGLLLDSPVYTSYNELVTKDPLRIGEPIQFEKFEDDIEKFKDEYIYKRMREIEKRTNVYNLWMNTVDAYDGDDFLWLNRMGTIPDEAIVIRGESRANRFIEISDFDRTDFQGDWKLPDSAPVEEVVDGEEEEETRPLSKAAAEELEG